MPDGSPGNIPYIENREVEKKDNTPPYPPDGGKPASAGDIDPLITSLSKELECYANEQLALHNTMFKPVKLGIMTKDFAQILTSTSATVEDIKRLLVWCLEDSFWHKLMYKKRNVAAYLREKFIQLWGAMTAPKPTMPVKERKFAPSSNDARALARIQEMRATAL